MAANPADEAVLAGGDEMGALMRSIDWSKTPLGPVSGWSQALRTMVGLALRTTFPMLIWWGPRFVQLYNDAYRPIPGAKHPRSMGQPGEECWAEIWNVIGPMAEAPFRGEPAATSDDLELYINRRGFLEETHYKISYSPIPDETAPRGIGGVLATVAEITGQIYGERQLRTLRDLGARAADAKTPEEACAIAAATLAVRDVPFALLYLLDDDGRTARLAGAHGLPEGHRAAPAAVDLEAPAGGWPFDLLARQRTIVEVPDLERRFGALPNSERGSSPAIAVALPLASPDQPRVYGFLLAAASPHRPLDEGYRSFFELAAAQVVTAIRNARAHQEERRRAEALAEIDRAKTTFFSNISHEFRTPLTLMLGPMEDALREGSLAGDSLETAWRNALRLLRLVNALLDFSRIEAGRMQATFAPTDIARATAELAAMFESAMARAGLAYKVRCGPIDGPVHLDAGMYEKIVLNLISNALKFTFEGEVEVALHDQGDSVELSVRDTGVGVAPEELPRLFERFHRVEGTRARTHEGSGIGLALVADLVKLHGGSVQADGAPGKGMIFKVNFPKGTRHLPAAQIGAARPPQPGAASAFVEEAMRWLPGAQTEPPGPAEADAMPGARILVADDNADMREYLSRLLGKHWPVEAVPDGAVALRRAREGRFDLVITDVMMPGLDGFSLLAALRADPALAGLPVLMLSARAGEESRIQGVMAGADDYIVKPFSGKELLARVQSQLVRRQADLELTRLRLEAERANRAKDEFLAVLGHELRNPLAPILTALQLMRLRGIDKAEKERTVIERQAHHLVRLVDDLLDVSRITRGKVELRTRRVELAEIVARAIETASPLLEQRRHVLTVNVPSEGFAVDGDPERLAQVISNLLNNAAKYTEQHGRITVSAERAGGQIALSVRDTGIGIAPEMLPKVFEMFVQERQALDRAQGGLGLGLTIARSLVALHGGSLEVKSEGRNRGAEFIVRLPAAGELEAGVRRRTESAAASAGADRPPCRVLVVDDNDDAAELLMMSLEDMGYTVRTAHDGPQALKIAGDFLPDLALLDIGLPVMDGYELARRLRELEGLSSMKLVALTGYGQENDRRRSLEAGFDEHLTKPVDISQVEQVIRELTQQPPQLALA